MKRVAKLLLLNNRSCAVPHPNLVRWLHAPHDHLNLAHILDVHQEQDEEEEIESEEEQQEDQNQNQGSPVQERPIPIDFDNLFQFENQESEEELGSSVLHNRRDLETF